MTKLEKAIQRKKEGRQKIYRVTLRLSKKQKQLLIWIKMKNIKIVDFVTCSWEASEEYKQFEEEYERNKEWLDRELEE